ncbi:cob(I)yrinic acid a,c-diamide adenosyltransferase [Candidatus Woesearchaeota archaeon]|nr:cob(I)yrinic acid a,c-diamide adenosyltransferase [Candidatus Woesearchaeota archaeon]
MVEAKPPKRTLVYLWTGTGWGKTTSALGVALRAIGHGKKVVIVQFMKGRKDLIGEYKVRKRLGELYEIHQFGRPGWVDLTNPSKEDKDLANEGLEFAKKLIKKSPPFILILDEVNIAAHIGLIKVKDVLAFLDTVPKQTTVYLTGRYAPKEFIKRADFATEVQPLKRPIPIEARQGIDY